MNRSHSLIVCLFLCLIAVLVFHTGFAAPFVVDSKARLLGPETVFKHGSFLDVLKIYLPRPVAMASFYINYQVTGLDGYAFRLVNALLLGGTGFALFAFLNLLLSLSPTTNELSVNQRRGIAFVAAAAYVTHPLMTFVVIYVVQRMALLATLFFLLGALTYTAARTGLIRNRVLGFGLCALCLGLGVLSKENAAVLPVGLVIIETALFQPGLRRAIKPLALASALIVLLVAVVSLLEWLPEAGERKGVFQIVAMHYERSGLTVWEVLLTQARLTWFYVIQSVAPFLSGVVFVKPVIIAESLTEPPFTWLAVLGVIAMGALGVAALFKRPLLGVGILFFFITLAPEALLVPAHLYFGHRAVLPLVGILIVAADAAAALLTWATAHGRSRTVGAALLFFGAAWVAGSAWTATSTAERWVDPRNLWKPIIAGFPPETARVERDARLLVMHAMVNAVMAEGDIEEALRICKRTLQYDPNSVHILEDLALIYWRTGRIDQAEAVIERALKLHPTRTFARYVKGVILDKTDRIDEAVKHLRYAASSEPENSRFQAALGAALMRQNRMKEAERHLRKAVALDPENAQGHGALAKLLLRRDKAEEAARHATAARKIDPDYADAHNTLGVLMAQSGKLREAEFHFDRAAGLDPEHPEAQRNLSTVRSQIAAEKRKE